MATIRGQTQYALSLSRLYATDEALRDGISFMDLDAVSYTHLDVYKRQREPMWMAGRTPA